MSRFLTVKLLFSFCLLLVMTNPSIFDFSLDWFYFFEKLLFLIFLGAVIVVLLSLAKTQNVKDFRMPNNLVKEMENGTEEIISKEFRKYSEEDKRRVRIAAIENNYTVGKVKYYYVLKKIVKNRINSTVGRAETDSLGAKRLWRVGKTEQLRLFCSAH